DREQNGSARLRGHFVAGSEVAEQHRVDALRVGDRQRPGSQEASVLTRSQAVALDARADAETAGVNALGIERPYGNPGLDQPDQKRVLEQVRGGESALQQP